VRAEYAGTVKMLTILYLILSLLLGYFSAIFMLITTVVYVVILIIYTGFTITKCVDILVKKHS